MGLLRKKKTDDGAIDFNKDGWFERAKPLADTGDTEMQLQTALSIFNDARMHEHIPLAMEYLRRASDSGNPSASGTLSMMYLTGLRGTEIYHDMGRAIELSAKATDDISGKYTRAMLILMGEVDGTADEAADLFMEAAEGGIEHARIYAAFVHASDLTGERDVEKAMQILAGGLKSKKIGKRCRGYINSLKKDPYGDVNLNIDLHTRDGNRKVPVIACAKRE